MNILAKLHANPSPKWLCYRHSYAVPLRNRWRHWLTFFFTSALLGELYQLIGTRWLRTSPYHPQIDELVEQFNLTLKAMLKKMLKGEKRNWDHMFMLPFVLFANLTLKAMLKKMLKGEKRNWDHMFMLPFVLFAYREVPQAAVGFSLFELQWMWCLKILDALQEEWIQDSDTETDILSYVMAVGDQKWKQLRR